MPSLSDIELNKEYLRTKPAILKLAEVFISLCCFISAVVKYALWNEFGTGASFVAFASFLSFVGSVALFLLNLFGAIAVIRRKFAFYTVLCELGYYVVLLIFVFVAAILSSKNAKLHSAIGAATFFSWVLFVLVAAQLAFQAILFKGIYKDLFILSQQVTIIFPFKLLRNTQDLDNSR
ncbi:DgyrCDS9705 [Dimorphilus gyrociliatus]|uniref:DgyrCDS9705 n=1 Tax=Dimorphilus gyrociliatus TaxID=2664684 RepID=A0A7I8W326_9ANNE|nr:DgyrCDS9705 [Dimorphilus gyrociliatus]